VGQDEIKGSEELRHDMAVAIRIVLEEGLLQAEDPISYLRSAAEEIRQIVGMIDAGQTGGAAEGAALRSLLMDEVEAATQELIRRLHH